MSDDLLHYYDRELRFLHKLAADFGSAHPKVATRLGIAGEKVEDPHVRRLLEGVAFLNARVRRKLDDEFPELATGLLSILYPHLLAPIPSLSIVQFVAKEDLGTAHRVARGTLLETEAVDDVRCRFQTAYAVDAWPIQVAGARLMPTPFRAPATPLAGEAAAVLELRLECSSAQMRFAELKPPALRFHLNLAAQHAAAMYELVFNDVLEIAVASGPGDPAPALLPATCVKPVGFASDEGLLPYPPQSFLGYRLLTEFFNFHEKFLFFDLEGLPAAKLATLGREMRVYAYVRRTLRELEGVLEKDKSASSFALNCTPVVNLFPHTADPIELDRSQSELLVTPDARRRTAFEVYSIERVTAIVSEDREVPCSPFFGIGRLGHEDERAVWWTQSRRRAEPREDEEQEPSATNGPSETWLALVEHGVLAQEKDVVLEVRITASNREIPKHLPYGSDRPRFTFAAGGGPIERIRCLKKPTDPLRPQPDDDRLWSLVSHLTLNQISLAGEHGTRALQEVLRLYDLVDSAANRAAIDGVLTLQTRPSVLRVQIDGQPGLVQGTELALALDADKLRVKGVFLFASVLERFLALYAHVNTYTQLVLRASDREGEVKRWAPRAGDRSLI